MGRRRRAHDHGRRRRGIGAAATIGLLIAGQLAMGVAIDRYGWFGVEQVALTWPRVLGVVLLAVGAALALHRR